MMVACLYTRVYTRMYVHACIYTHAYSREMPFTCYTHAHTRNCTSTHTSTHTYKHTYIIHTDTTYGVKYIQAQNISNTYRHKLWRCNTLSMVSTYGSMYTQPVDLHTNQYRGKQTSPGVQRHTNKPELTTPNLIALSQKTPNHECVCVCGVYIYSLLRLQPVCVPFLLRLLPCPRPALIHATLHAHTQKLETPWPCPQPHQRRQWRPQDASSCPQPSLQSPA